MFSREGTEEEKVRLAYFSKRGFHIPCVISLHIKYLILGLSAIFGRICYNFQESSFRLSILATQYGE